MGHARKTTEALGLLVLGLAGCGSESAPPRTPSTAKEETPKPAPPPAPIRAPAKPTTSTTKAQAKTPNTQPCPEGMVHVEKDYCPKMERTCLKSEYDKSNHITLCHRFREGSSKCKARRVKLDFCIDRYEYPNKKGAKPPVMVDFYDATGLCAKEGKRLCYEGEWVAACEGPKEKPFPHSWERSKEKCNIDNHWINPSLKKIYSRDPKISGPELERLWQGVPSGSKPECVSDYGVYDLTGNVDEWTLADHDRPKERAVFAALKGGAWGHVRNACRPVTTSHEPTFRYYFVSFRCCKDTKKSARELKTSTSE